MPETRKVAHHHPTKKKSTINALCTWYVANELYRLVIKNILFKPPGLISMVTKSKQFSHAITSLSTAVAALYKNA